MIKVNLGCTTGSMRTSHTRGKGEVRLDMTHFLYDKNLFRQIIVKPPQSPQKVLKGVWSYSGASVWSHSGAGVGVCSHSGASVWSYHGAGVGV